MKGALLLACCAILVGCGGSGGGGSTSPIAQWNGTWGGPTPPPGDTGTLNIEIEADGDIAGTAHNNGRNENGSISGSIAPDGKFSFVIDYPSHDCEVHGTFTPDGNAYNSRWAARSEEYNRTIHLYSFWVNLHRQN
jgi:hypothetical protein